MREDKCCWVGTHALSGSRFGSRISFCGTGISVTYYYGLLYKNTNLEQKHAVGCKFPSHLYIYTFETKSSVKLNFG